MKRYQVIQSSEGFRVIDAFAEGYPALSTTVNEIEAMERADALNAWGTIAV
jgi:hypothetical protein